MCLHRLESQADVACSLCGKTQPRSEYWASSSAPGGIMRVCRTCLHSTQRPPLDDAEAERRHQRAIKANEVRWSKHRDKEIDVVRRVEEKQRARGECPAETVGPRAA